MENIFMLIVGIFISVIGIINIRVDISPVHWYNRRKVRQEDVPKYGKAVGTGSLIIGIAIIIAYVVSFWSETAITFIILPAFVVGLGFILYGQIKYNRGIF